MTAVAPAYEVTRLNNGFDFLPPLQFLDYRRNQFPNSGNTVSPDGSHSMENGGEGDTYPALTTVRLPQAIDQGRK